MNKLVVSLLACATGIALVRWYQREVELVSEATLHLQSEHEHFHFHVDLPAWMEIQAGDTLEVLSLPQLEWETHGEVTYLGCVRLTKASWLRRTLIKRSSLIEINELVEHP